MSMHGPLPQRLSEILPGGYPRSRLRRTRQASWSRALVGETRLAPSDLIWPTFVHEGPASAEPVPSLPGVMRYSVDRLVDEVGAAAEAGIPAVALFPVVPTDRKNAAATEAWDPDNLLCRAVRAIKAAHRGIGVICDVALDPYTLDGHDGLVRDGRVLNDETVEALVDQSVVLAEAGTDMVAPSDMMDGRVGAIRTALESRGLQDTMILAYAAKYASAFYGPFRDAVDAAKALGGDGKRTYQLDPSNGDEALREVALDVAEGADAVMVKPALPYLDILRRVKDAFGMPTFAYQVSGEYAMIEAAAAHGWVDREAAIVEALIGCRRAGADAVLTYAARDVAGWIAEGRLEGSRIRA